MLDTLPEQETSLNTLSGMEIEENHWRYLAYKQLSLFYRLNTVRCRVQASLCQNSSPGKSLHHGHWKMCWLKFVVIFTTAFVKKKYTFLWLQRKLRVVWQIAASDVIQWLNCIVGNKQSTDLALHSFNTVGVIMDGLISPFLFHTFLLPCPHYPRCNLASERNQAIYQITCSFPRSHKRPWSTFFYTCSSTAPRPVNTLNG